MPKVTLKKKINKFSPDEVSVRVGWFISLKELADKYEKYPTPANLACLLGYISSAECIIKTMYGR